VSTVAGALLEAVAARDFDRLADHLADDVRMRALLPPGPQEWHGRAGVRDVFAGWFGYFSGFGLVDSTVGEAGTRGYVRWRLRTLEDGGEWHNVEQHAYVRTDDAGLIHRIDLLCTGYWLEPDS
jgi:ketosteroid isomerase-like protein